MDLERTPSHSGRFTMPVPCPCCKAVNEAGPVCRRCKADLGLLFQLEANRESLLNRAKSLAQNGELAESLDAVRKARELRRGEDAQRLRVAVLLLARDFSGALAAYHEVTTAARAAS